MTLILGMSKSEGAYLCVDYRVSNAVTGEVIDDDSVKYLTIDYPPYDTGPRALLAYTGIAKLPDGTGVGDWIRETLRGESETINESMEHLRSRLNRDIAKYRKPLIVNTLVVEPGKRFFGGLSNVRTFPQVGPPTLVPDFRYLMHEITDPLVFSNGSGARWIRADGHEAVLDKQSQVLPRDPFDHMKLLASINRKVAARDSGVSPYCHVSFLNADSRWEPKCHAFTESGETVSFAMPHILYGVDLDPMTRRFMEQATDLFERGIPLPEPDDEAMNEELRRRP